MRSPGTLLLAVLVADLVFLQTAWQLYKFVCEFFFNRRYPDANWCHGCLDKPAESQLEQAVETTTGKNYLLVRQRENEVRLLERV